MMQLASSAKTYRRGLNLYLGFIALITLIYGLITARVSRSWVIADWLINYQGGFVRRGLAGEIAYLLGRLLHLSPIYFVVLTYLALYLALFLGVRSLAIRSSWNLWVLALLLSPATLSFQVLDATAGFRKELIFLAALAIFLVLLRDGRLSPVRAAIYIGLVVVTGTLTHESLICFAPYFFGALVITGRTPVQAARQCVVPFVIGIVAAYFCAHYLGDRHTAVQICSSLGYKLLPQGGEICSGGAIAYLGVSREMARAETLFYFQHSDYLSVYGWTALLALAPLVGGSIALFRSGRRREVQVVWSVAALSLVGSLILFLYATDWGRWIYIHVLCIGLLLLYVDGERSADVVAAPSKPHVPRWVAGTLLFAYAGLWTLPHVPNQTPRFGYVGLVRYAMEYRHRHPLPIALSGTAAEAIR